MFKSGSWILPAGGVFLACAFAGWALAFFTGQSTSTQSSWTGWGCALGLALAAGCYQLLAKDSTPGE